jgi:hypothetical protein
VKARENCWGRITILGQFETVPFQGTLIFYKFNLDFWNALGTNASIIVHPKGSHWRQTIGQQVIQVRTCRDLWSEYFSIQCAFLDFGLFSFAGHF